MSRWLYMDYSRPATSFSYCCSGASRASSRTPCYSVGLRSRGIDHWAITWGQMCRLRSKQDNHLSVILRLDAGLASPHPEFIHLGQSGDVSAGAEQKIHTGGVVRRLVAYYITSSAALTCMV
jgi:hypothetical protein